MIFIENVEACSSFNLFFAGAKHLERR
jgi:hypothetical protein